MSSKKTRKEHEKKRREKLEARANIDAFRIQLEMKIRYRFPELGEDHPAVVAEMDAICAAGLAEGMIVLGKMVTGIRTEMGVNPEADKGSLIGAIVPYVLGITMENPIENGQLDSTLANAAEIKTAMDELTQKVYAIFGKLYQQQPGAGQPGPEGYQPPENGSNIQNDDGSFNADGTVE